MKLLNFLVIKLSLFFLLGVYLGLQFPFSVELLWYGIFVDLILLAGFHLLYLRSFKINYPFSLLAYFVFIAIGMLSSSIQQPKNQQKHIIHFVEQNQPHWLEVEIYEVLKSNDYNYKYIAQIQRMDSVQVHGRVLLQISKELENQAFAVGDELLLNSTLLAFEDPKNPQAFNYKAYMQNQLVLFQAKPKVYVHQSRLQAASLTTKAARLRDTIQHKLRAAGFNESQLGILQALLLGQKKQIDPETYANFSKAGVVHILAVSGLHVGIVLLLLQGLFRPMDYVKNGRVFKTLLIVVLLWGFALIAGFSPSVTRAVTMFSLFAIAINMKRKTNTINILCLSLFPILLFKPHFILQVGFQLSYAAVFSIVMLQPKLYALYIPRFYIDKVFWTVFTVTISAQLGVLPFSLYYFQQFPGLFIIANLVIIPFLGILLGVGILVILLALLGWLGDFLVNFYGFLLDLLLQFVNLIALKEDFVFTEIFFNFPMFLFLLLMVCSLLFYVRSRRYQFALCFLGGCVGLTWALALALHQQRNTAEIVIFNEYRKAAYGIKKGNKFTFYFSDSIPNPNEIWSLKNYLSLRNIKELSVEEPISFCMFNSDESLIMIDSTAIYPKKLRNAYVYLSQSPQLNLDRLILEIQPRQIIADANNYTSYIKQWENSCKKYNIPFHSTYRDGAWIKEVEKVSFSTKNNTE